MGLGTSWDGEKGACSDPPPPRSFASNCFAISAFGSPHAAAAIVMCGVENRLTFGVAISPDLGGEAALTGVGNVSSAFLLVNFEHSPRNMSIKMPAMMPLWMEYVNGTTVIVRKAGMATRKLSQSMPRQGAIMKAPISTSGTAVATCGMALRTGPMKAERKKRIATTTAMSPVFAPSTMPALLSFAMITGLVPSMAPTIVERPAAEKIEALLGTFPSFSRPAMPMRPYCTPAMSKRATKSMAVEPINMAVRLPLTGSQAAKLTMNVESNLGKSRMPAGGSARPKIQAQPAMAQMPMSIAPWTSPTTNMAEIRRKPASAK
mmetsp:Transcript_57211/g.185940  ORF Transcript_57211/g.185940 Transcript_57211/m.185940 type:complete len:319 (-) Transcript_57211:721-1677(-)